MAPDAGNGSRRSWPSVAPFLTEEEAEEAEAFIARIVAREVAKTSDRSRHEHEFIQVRGVRNEPFIKNAAHGYEACVYCTRCAAVRWIQIEPAER